MHMSNGCSLLVDELEECPESDSIGAHAVCTRISLVFDDSPHVSWIFMCPNGLSLTIWRRDSTKNATNVINQNADGFGKKLYHVYGGPSRMSDPTYGRIYQ